MIKSVVVSPLAEADIRETYVWYQERVEGLGSTFLDELDSVFQRILNGPYSYPEVETDIRRCVAHSFPYLVFYTLSDFAVTILAVLHAAQDPAHIAGRLGA